MWSDLSGKAPDVPEVRKELCEECNGNGFIEHDAEGWTSECAWCEGTGRNLRLYKVFRRPIEFQYVLADNHQQAVNKTKAGNNYANWELESVDPMWAELRPDSEKKEVL